MLVPMKTLVDRLMVLVCLAMPTASMAQSPSLQETLCFHHFDAMAPRGNPDVVSRARLPPLVARGEPKDDLGPILDKPLKLSAPGIAAVCTVTLLQDRTNKYPGPGKEMLPAVAESLRVKCRVNDGPPISFESKTCYTGIGWSIAKSPSIMAGRTEVCLAEAPPGGRCPLRVSVTSH